ncbi:MAG: ABC transporter ATP-binding protein [Kiritimatiellae bacterium]|nr:ABC transporter ATP-binding protein [Kiritimatiellia bacterium]
MARNVIEIQGLHKSFAGPVSLRHPFSKGRKNDVLRGVDLDLQEGEILGLVGPNGAGKSTLLRIIATLITPDAGTVRVDGHDAVRDVAGVKTRLGCVMAGDRSFYWRLSVAENLRFFGILNNLAPGAVFERMNEAAGVLGIEGELRKPFRTLSDGNRQRVALARALMTDPEILLIDELTRSLDPGIAARLLEFLRGGAGGRARSVLLVTHSLREVDAVCDRAALLAEGKIAVSGPVAEVRAEIESGLSAASTASGIGKARNSKLGIGTSV